MNYKQIAAIELETGSCGIELKGADGMCVFFYPRNPNKIEIAGDKGRITLNRAQAIALANELMGIVETYMEEK